MISHAGDCCGGGLGRGDSDFALWFVKNGNVSLYGTMHFLSGILVEE